MLQHIARKSTPAIVGSVLWHAEQRLRAYGAILNANLTTDVTHVIVDAANSIEVENVKVHIEYHILSDKNTDSIYAADVKCQVRELRFSTAYKFEKEIVDLTWINKCISTGLIVPAFITKS